MYGDGYERLLEYTSGSAADTSGCQDIRVVRRRIRAVRGLYEWFSGGYERLPGYTSGSPTDTSG
ncbi:hypothetical protein [Sporosarcina cyprini]|uniref:hypothetical protein n=1 Tax=Sporosarcina cyprini TaxID=2910523 RepID=UPI001EDF2563|nr:hypothetical protein [Sporosarcina cyprini]MCG3088701.1 hypothetical protein [Sporosarcina cyprini]